MGYELSIQRDENHNKITKEEWLNYINSDSEFENIEELSQIFDNDKVLTVPVPNGGLWKVNDIEVPFTFSEKYGWISVKNPDESVIEKLSFEVLDYIYFGPRSGLYF